MADMALIDLAMFAVDAFGWIAYALFSLFGPLAIPLYMTKHFSSKFWGWLDGLIVFSFYRAVSAGFSFIWINVLVGFFDNTVAGDYSLGHWLAILGTLIMLTGAFFWGMFKQQNQLAIHSDRRAQLGVSNALLQFFQKRWIAVRQQRLDHPPPDPVLICHFPAPFARHSLY
jgi:hypothetical protein